ncbi:hypothetical protein M409DRAFT_66395 [Zasmidium cellare ATCC 36951]|uniref:Zn(2)-C6 fungal-type domain-containing protein n=1 Tax=Zasmidium cellare ATCC 36951 TaxID=1080233 RepID=A0A6A6CHY7_ZASCE|nr:uncharacterized protein M409DRAFT_66395 [Zasmidium cellare ATCC 36951]KAF2166834.1 hypothetical protein M409DRAFT_66395 [Zasmidium cellare ATCC 36951]
MESRAPRVGHKKSRKGCAQCKRRHVKCNEEAPCSNCVRHGVACSLAGGPYVPREDAKARRKSTASSDHTNPSRTASLEASVNNTGSTSAVESPSAPSPFTVLTGLIDRPISGPGQEQNWQLDLQLMHHYMSNTKFILNETQDIDFILRIWQEELPKVAFTCDYVMHGLLGFSALHKAVLDPENAPMLQASAVDHLDKALVLYRRDSSIGTPESANAKFAFTWLVALFAYAIPPSVPPIDAMVELFLLVKGIDAILSETWYWVAQGPFAAILTRGFQEAITLSPDGSSSTYTIPDGMDFGLAHLDFMLGVDAMIPDDRRVCAVVLAELKQIYDSVLRSDGSCSVASILCFPKQDPVPFAELIRRRVPQALIVLSYYCVLMDVLDNRWWINGWSSRVITDVMGSLDEPWKHWIEWPVESILYKQATTAGPGTADMAIDRMLV